MYDPDESIKFHPKPLNTVVIWTWDRPSVVFVLLTKMRCKAVPMIP